MGVSARKRLGSLSRVGRLRRWHVVATSVIRLAVPENKAVSPWLLKLLERRSRKLAAIALANKLARILWAMMTNETAYRRTPQTA